MPARRAIRARRRLNSGKSMRTTRAGRGMPRDDRAQPPEGPAQGAQVPHDLDEAHGGLARSRRPRTPHRPPAMAGPPMPISRDAGAWARRARGEGRAVEIARRPLPPRSRCVGHSSSTPTTARPAAGRPRERRLALEDAPPGPPRGRARSAPASGRRVDRLGAHRRQVEAIVVIARHGLDDHGTAPGQRECRARWPPWCPPPLRPR